MDVTPARLRAFIRDIEKPAGEFGCWHWRGSVNGDGYGHVGHRVAYQWMVGPIDAGMDIDHLCRNRACVNPGHLEPVTRSENIRRSREYGPRPFRKYCRKGHALVGDNARLWSNGSLKEVRCYTCHRIGCDREGERHAS